MNEKDKQRNEEQTSAVIDNFGSGFSIPAESRIVLYSFGYVMGAGASKKYVIDEIRAATPDDLTTAFADLSSQERDALMEAQRIIAQMPGKGLAPSRPAPAATAAIPTAAIQPPTFFAHNSTSCLRLLIPLHKRDH